MVMKRPDVDIYIDQLVLSGFEHVSGAAVDAAVRAELRRRFAEEGATAIESRRTHRLDGGSFQLPAGAGAEVIGSQIGRSLFSRIRR